MGSIGLAEFIDAERGAIMAEWVTFARTLFPAAIEMTGPGLRDHGDEILRAIVADMKSLQTAAEQAKKSKGRAEASRVSEIGKLHAVLRLESGFKVGQLMAEYRALRASVLRLWQKKGHDPEGVTRFNEAIDEALTASVQKFIALTEKYRDQTLGMLAHDLRNPLSAIVMGLSVMLTEELGDQRTVADMLDGANRMSRMITDLLDLTRTRFGDPIPVVPKPMDLEPLCRQVIAELERLRPSGGLHFTRTGDLRGEWDGDRMAQVLSNLVGNAIQHGVAGDPITLHAMDCGDEIVMRVHNGGPAIPPDALATLFEPMVRHTENDGAKTGLGLGLYIASQVVLAHGGTLDVSSSDGGGTTFTIHLPRRAPTGGTVRSGVMRISSAPLEKEGPPHKQVKASGSHKPAARKGARTAPRD